MVMSVVGSTRSENGTGQHSKSVWDRVRSVSRNPRNHSSIGMSHPGHNQQRTDGSRSKFTSSSSTIFVPLGPTRGRSRWQLTADGTRAELIVDVSEVCAGEWRRCVKAGSQTGAGPARGRDSLPYQPVLPDLVQLLSLAHPASTQTIPGGGRPPRSAHDGRAAPPSSLHGPACGSLRSSGPSRRSNALKSSSRASEGAGVATLPPVRASTWTGSWIFRTWKVRRVRRSIWWAA